MFVIALNQTVVRDAIKQHYPNTRGEDYIKKLIQVEFQLPPLRPEDIKQYVDGLTTKLGIMSQEVSDGLAGFVPLVAGDNPREVKRFVNRVLLSIAIARKAGVEVPVRRQIAFVTAISRWPEFGNALSKNSNLVAAKFDDSKLQGTDFTGAIVDKADFSGTSIKGARFRVRSKKGTHF